jgi:hypothetical protein
MVRIIVWLFELLRKFIRLAIRPKGEAGMQDIPIEDLEEGIKTLKSNTEKMLEHYSTSKELPLPARQDARRLLEQLRKSSESEGSSR